MLIDKFDAVIGISVRLKELHIRIDMGCISWEGTSETTLKEMLIDVWEKSTEMAVKALIEAC